MNIVNPQPLWLTGGIVSIFLLSALPTHALVREERMAPPIPPVYATTSADEYLPAPTLPLIENKPVAEPDLINEVERPLATFAQDRIINLAANISNRLDSALTRLQNIQARMESRATTMRAAGLDTSLALTSLEENKIILTRSAEQLASIDSLVYYATTAPTPKLAWMAVSAKYKVIATDLRDSKALLTTTLTDLKASTTSIQPTEVASSTDSDLLIP